VRIGECLRVLYPPDPGETGWIGSLEPDRLAEWHALRELTASTDLARACLTGLDARQALQAMTLLARASADDPHAGELLRQALPGAADLITPAVLVVLAAPGQPLGPAAPGCSRRRSASRRGPGRCRPHRAE
jgi:hypothetical protein